MDGRVRRVVGRWWAVVPGVALGGWFGWTIAQEMSEGGWSAAFAPAVAMVLLVIAAGTAGIGALLMRWTPARPVGRAIGVAAVASIVAGLLPLVLIPMLGLGYRPPVSTSGSMSMQESSVEGITAGSGPARCTTAENADWIQVVFGLDLGRIVVADAGLGGTLRGGLDRPDGSSEAWRVELLVDGGSLPEGAAQPFWTGPVAVDASAGGRSGSATFGPLEGAPAPWPNGWSGVLRWSCE